MRTDEASGKYVFLGSQTERDRQREMGFFAQDAWRVRPNLTSNGGLGGKCSSVHDAELGICRKYV
jgi:hypothetical protein